MDITTLAAAKTYTNNKVEEIINGGDAFVVDPTLSLSGVAADAKITGDRLALLENYVTPEMYGANGDGEKDDTDAISKALKSGKPVLLCNEYAISKPIEGSASYIYGINAKIKLLNNVDRIFTLNSNTHISGIEFDCNKYSVQTCILLSNIDNVEVKDTYIHDVYNYQNDIGATLISVTGCSMVNIDNIRVENCYQAGNKEEGDTEGNLSCIYVTNYSKLCSIQNITINEIHNFDVDISTPMYEDTNGIYVRSGEVTAETSLKNLNGYNYGKRFIKSQCAGHITIDSVTAYNNSMECLSALGLMEYDETTKGTATVSNCQLVNESERVKQEQYLIASNIKTTIVNCVLKSGNVYLAFFNKYKMIIQNCHITGNGVHIEGENYTYIDNCNFNIEKDGIFLREYEASKKAVIKVSDCIITCGRTHLTYAQLYVDNCQIGQCHMLFYSFAKLTNSTIFGTQKTICASQGSELVAENITITVDENLENSVAFYIGKDAIAKITNINATNFFHDILIEEGHAILRGVNMEKVNCEKAASFTNYPEYVENFPNSSFMTEGAKIILASDNKLYRFIRGEWITNEVGNASGIIIDIDQSYNPNSKNAQSGKAVQDIISKIAKIEKTTLSHSVNYMPDKSEFIYGWIMDSLKLYESSGNMLSPFIKIDESLIGKKLTVQRKAGFVWERMGYIKSITAFNAITELDTNNSFNSKYVIETLANITQNSEDGTYAVYTIPEGTKYLRISIGNDYVTNENYQTMFVINDDESLLGEYVANESIEIEGKKELVDDMMVNGSNLSEDAMQKISEKINNDYVTPQMFGAAADGVTDDTAAVQSALDHGGMVYFPAGVYKVTRQLTTTKPCVIKMFKQYPSQFWRSGNTSGRYDYPIIIEEGKVDYENEKGWDFGARIECYPSDDEQYGLLIGDGCEVDGLFMRAMNGFSGVLLAYDNSHSYGIDNLGDSIKYQSYPSAARFSHIRLDCDRHHHETTIPESMFDFYPHGKYFYIFDDIVIGQNDEFATYGFRSILDEEASWANSVRLKNLCLNGLFDYPLYIVEENTKHSLTNWIFDGLSIQTFGYNYDDFQKTLEGHKAVITLRRLNYCLFTGCYVWDLFAAKYIKLFDCENLNNISCVGCSEEFYYGTKKLIGDAGEDGIETVLRDRLQESGANVKTLTMNASVSEDGGNRVNLSDNYGNTIYADLPPVVLSDGQLSESVGSWMDNNALPVEQEGKNKLDIYSKDMMFGYNLNKDGNLVQATAGTAQARYVVTYFIPAKCGDVFRMSHNGKIFNWSEIHEYDKDFKFLQKYNYSDEAVGTGFSVAIKNPDTAYIRVNFSTLTYMTDEEKTSTTFVTNLEVVERGNFCITLNNPDISYEPYEVKLVGGLAQYFLLQSPNGTKYSISVTDDGQIVGKLITD